MVLTFILGVLIGIVAISAGVFIGVKVTSYSVDSYVKKLTPEDTEKIYGARKQEIPEENLRALDINEEEYHRVMGWNNRTPQEEATY